MESNKVKEKMDYEKRAKEGVKTLVRFFCVTRPQYEKCWRNANGKFDLSKFLSDWQLVSEWHNYTPEIRKRNGCRYAQAQKHLNLCLGIPWELLVKVCGKYKGEDGAWKNVSVENIVQQLLDEGFMRKISHGTKSRQNEKGEWKVMAWWRNKYVLNKKEWRKLIKDKDYSDYKTFPLDKEGFVLRALKIIEKWLKKTYPKSFDKRNKPKEWREGMPKTDDWKLGTKGQQMVAREMALGVKRGLATSEMLERELKNVGWTDRFVSCFKVWVEKNDIAFIDERTKVDLDVSDKAETNKEERNKEDDNN